MTRIVGIDLGTTNSCIAVADKHGDARVIATASGARTIPSVVSFDNTRVHVGVGARRRTISHPQSTIYGSKRLIGTKVTSPGVRWFESTAPFKIAAGPNGDAWLITGDELIPPQEISAFVLSELKLIAEQALGEPVTRAVITVPAYFSDAQRQATMDAGRVAGLDVVRIVNEPTAAALAHGAHRTSASGNRYLVVVDLGGGTFDVSVMRISNGVFQVLATSGDMSLGGDDWDSYLLHFWLRQISQEHDVDASSDPVARGRLLEAAEQVKRHLSAGTTAHVNLPHLITTETGALHFETTITRREFENITAALVHKLEKPCRDALDTAAIPLESISEVLLVGGMSRVPMIERKVFEVFGRQPSKGANPDEIVALGAAAHAAILEGTRDDATLLDVTPLSIGIRAGNSQVVQMVPRNSLLPVRVTKRFTTTRNNQREFHIELHQGHASGTSKRLGDLILSDLPLRPAGTVRVEVSVTIDTDSIVHVQAVEESSGRQSKATMRTSGGLSQADLDRLVERHRSFRGAPEG